MISLSDFKFSSTHICSNIKDEFIASNIILKPSNKNFCSANLFQSFAGINGYLDEVNLDKINQYESELAEYLSTNNESISWLS